MSAKPFVDTNILIYAYDIDAGIKHERAGALIRKLWEKTGGSLSTQVLQEFHVNVTKKIPKPISPGKARSIIDCYRAWHIETITVDTLLRASEIQERNRLSFWDAMIVAASVQANSEVLWTEDLNDGQVIEGVEIRNPLTRAA